MRILTATDVRQALPMAATIAAMRRAYAAVSSGQAMVPLRSQLPIPTYEAVNLFMPAYVPDKSGDSLAIKIVAVYPQNPDRGLPTIHAAVLVLEAETGRPIALLEGGTLTALRTGAASGAATDLLSREDSQVVAVVGAGAQGRTQLEAVCTVRSIQRGWIYDLNAEKAAKMAADLAGEGPVPNDLRVATAPEQAVREADIICTATTSNTPVLEDGDLKSGVHINGVGSYTPFMQEIPMKTVIRSRVYVDSRTACLAEAGDIIQPLEQGVISEDHIYAELGEVGLGEKDGRTDTQQLTFFKSVGLAVQDVMAASLALTNADKWELGKVINWTM